MTAAAAARVGLRLGDRSVDVAIPHGVPVYEVLRAAAVDLDDPTLTIVDSTGRPVDLYLTTGDQLADGTVLHALSGRGPRGGASGAADDRSSVSRPAGAPWWLAVAGSAAVVLATTVWLDLVSAPAGQGGTAGRTAVVILLLVAALALATSGRRPGAFGSLWPTAVAASAGFAAGALSIPSGVHAAGQLMVVVGLLAASCVTAVRWATVRRCREPAADLAGVVLVVLTVAGALSALALLVGLPGGVAAAVLLGAVPLALRALPSMCVDVPDEQLIDVAQVATTVVSVRDALPEPLGPVNHRQVHRTVQAAERRRDAGTVVLSLVAPVVAPVVLLGAEPGTGPGRAAVVTTVMVATVLALLPRTTRGTLVRWAPRVCGAVLLLELAALAGGDLVGPVLGTVATVLIGLLVVAVSLPLGRGWRSVGLSRMADVLEGMAAVLALPVALVAAGAVETLRQLTSG